MADEDGRFVLTTPAPLGANDKSPKQDAWNKDLDFIKAMVRFEIDQAVFDIATARQHLTSADPQARYALTRFSEAEKLSQLSRGKSSRIGQ